MSVQVGSIDERGYLNGLTRRGYTHAKCILELAANVLDSMDMVQSSCRRLVFDIKQEYTSLIDNAAGMKEEDIRNMFSLHRENHGSDASRGVSGIGAKPALSILAQKQDVVLYTKHVNGPFLKISVPWSQIHQSGIYTGKIEVSQMNDTEKEHFITERGAYGMINGMNAHGTTIRFPTNTELTDIIRQNFQGISESDLNNPLDRMGVVFGREDIDFVYKHFEGQEPEMLSLYNYFGQRESNYYTGVSTHTIEQWSNHHEHRFLWIRGDEKYEILPHGRGFSTSPSLSTRNTRGYQHVGDYTVRVGLRNQREYFNPLQPKEPENTTSVYGADKEFLGEDPHDYLPQNKLYRNNMLIGLIPTPDIKISSSRANAKADLEYRRVQVEVSFSPVSLQDNAQDRAMNIQENKNQFDGKSIALNFTRLLKAMRKEKADAIWLYMETVIQEHRLRVVEPEPQPEPEPEVDADDTTISPVSEPSERPPSIVVEDGNDESSFSTPLPSPRIAPTVAPAETLPIPGLVVVRRKTHMTLGGLSRLDTESYMRCMEELEQILQRYSLDSLA